MAWGRRVSTRCSSRATSRKLRDRTGTALCRDPPAPQSETELRCVGSMRHLLAMSNRYADGDGPRWDSYARIGEPLWSRMPTAHTGGNHEVSNGGENWLGCVARSRPSAPLCRTQHAARCQLRVVAMHRAVASSIHAADVRVAGTRSATRTRTRWPARHPSCGTFLEASEPEHC